MKISKVIYTILLMIAIIVCCCGICNAVGLPDLDGYQPKVETGRAINIISSILGVLTVVGIIAIVVSIGLIGFNIIMGSASEKAVSQEKLVGLVIAAAVLTGGSIIATVLIGVSEKFVA